LEIIKDGHLQSTCIIIRRNAALINAAFTAEVRRGARPHGVHTGAAYSSSRLRKRGSPRKRRMHSARCKGLLQAFPMLSQSFKIPLKHRWALSGRRRETEVFLPNISQSFRVKPLTSARRKGNARRAIRGRREASSRPKGKRMANKKLLPLQLRSMRIPEGFESACS